MFKKMSLAIGALALAACLGAAPGAYAQDQSNTPGNNPSASSPSGAQDQQNGADMGRRGRRRNRGGDATPGMGMTGTPMPMVGPERINWSRQYVLTPLDQKRLQAMGLSKEEVWAVAKAAHESNEDVDTVANMVLRGRSYWQIADELNIPYDSMFKWPQRWQSADWAEEVREGSPVYYPRSAGAAGENGGMNRGRM